MWLGISLFLSIQGNDTKMVEVVVRCALVLRVLSEEIVSQLSKPPPPQVVLKTHLPMHWGGGEAGTQQQRAVGRREKPDCIFLS